MSEVPCAPALKSQVMRFSKFKEHRKLRERSYRGKSLIRKRTPLRPYRRPMPRVVGRSWGGGRFLWAR